MSATYTVVTLDGQEHANLDAETVKEWFLRKRLREDSFVMSSDTPEWKLLKKVFNVTAWLSQNFAQTQYPQQMPQQPVYQQQAYPQQMAQQQTYPQQVPQQPAYNQHAQQHNYYPAQPEVNTNWQQQQYQQQQYQQQQYQQQYQPQQQWVSQQNWVAPPPAQSFGQIVSGIFESATGRAKAATICLKISMGILGATALIDLMTIVSPPDMQALAQGQMSPATAMLMMFAGLVTLLHLGAIIATAIVFLMWLYRAYRNLHAFGMATEVSPGWVVGYWFIPIVNLFRPYQRVNELLEKSITIASRFGCNANIIDPSKAGAWWACYLISGLIGRAADRSSLSASSSESLVFAAVLDMASAILGIFAGWFIITIIQSVDEMHEGSISVVSRNPYMR